MGFALITAVILFPVVELILMIKIGSAVGILPLFAMLIAMGLAGGFMLRRQGLAAARRTFEQMARHEAPVESMIDGIGLTLAGFLFLLPGLLSDVAGLLLLVPPIRRTVVSRMLGFGVEKYDRRSARSRAQTASRGADRSAESPRSPSGASSDGVVIDGEFERIDERTIRPGAGPPSDAGGPKRSQDGPSGGLPWQR